MNPVPRRERPAGTRFPDERKRRLLPFAALPAAVAVVLAIVLLVGGGGVPAGAVAEVDDQEITQRQFDKWLNILARAQQQGEQQGQEDRRRSNPVPDRGDPRYPALRDRVMEFLINKIWIEEEAADRDVTVSTRQVDELFTQQKDQSFDSEKQFRGFLRDSGQSVDDVKLQIRLTLLQERMRGRITPSDSQPEAMAERYGVDADAIEKYYEVNKKNFRQPEQRDVRVIVNRNRSRVERAKRELERDSSQRSWRRVARRYSTDEATKDDGGLLPAVTEGQQEEALDKAIFDASRREIVGPVRTTTGWYVFQVQKITDEKTQPLKDVRESIQQTLIGEAQQARFEAFVNDFRAKWQDRTQCRNGYRVSDCDNPPGQSATRVPGQPAVSLPRAKAPGGAAGATGLPQGPIPAAEEQPAVPGAGGGGLPPGLEIPGGSGAPPGQSQVPGQSQQVP